MRRHSTSICTTLALVLTGCATSPGPLDDDPTALSFAAPSAKRVSPRIQDTVALNTESGPDDYVKLALQRNPSIRSAQERLKMLAERVPQVTSLNDPMFMITPIGDMAETAAGQTDWTASVSQKLPFPGKLDATGRIANQNIAMARQDLEQTRLSVIADTRRAWWNLYYATRAIEVTQASRKLVEQFRHVAQAKLRAGTATQQDVLRASVELSNTDNDLLTLKQNRSTAAAMLNSLMDRPVDAQLPDPPTVKLRNTALKLDRLLQESADANPQVQKVQERIKAYHQRLRLARLNRWPDLTVGLNYTAVENSGLSPVANGDDQWTVGFGFNLPIWNSRLDAAEREARRGILQGSADLQQARNMIAFQVKDALVKVETQHRQAVLFRDVIIPQARQTVDASQTGYQANKVSFLTLIDNWRKLLNFELMNHRSLSQFEQELAELQRVVGKDIEREGDQS